MKYALAAMVTVFIAKPQLMALVAYLLESVESEDLCCPNWIIINVNNIIMIKINLHPIPK